MGRNLLRHASLSLYNYFNTHEAQHHDMIFNHRIDILPYRYPYSVVVPCMPVWRLKNNLPNSQLKLLIYNLHGRLFTL